MSDRPIDLRSDTVTLPTQAMRKAMHDAELGDDVIDIDPTIERLQQVVADRLGKESALFMPSGTMTNQVAVRVHCLPGDELICEEDCHIYNYEQGAYAALSGVATRTVAGKNGILCLDQLGGLIREDDEHSVRTRLLCLENTHNRSGGRVLPFDETRRICEWAATNQIARHLDGARLFNAVVASGISAEKWCDGFDTVSVCFSKGLGAPVGSVLAGTKEQMKVARRHRKLFGGGMRQAGVIAAAALFALENNIERLAEDHEHAKIIADYVDQAPGVELATGTVESNIVMIRVTNEQMDADRYVERLEATGVRTMTFSASLFRAVTHLHINEQDAHSAGRAICQIAEQLIR